MGRAITLLRQSIQLLSWMADIKAPGAFRPLYERITKGAHRHRYKVFYGGRGGAKSWQFADALLFMGNLSEIKVLCAREIQKSIKESVHSTLERRIKDHGFTGYQVLANEIRHTNGTQFIFEGLYQNIDSIKSIDSIDICWIEEATAVSEHSWKLLTPSIRKEGSEIWISFNPDLEQDAVYQRFIVDPPKDAAVVKVSHRDNHWFPKVLLDEMEELKAKDYEEYLHVWEGELKQFGEGSIYEKQLRAARKDNRVCNIPIERTIPVNTFWDLGRNDTTAIWFHQRVGLENRFLFAYEHRLVGLSHYINYLKEWARARDITFGEHYLPHDVEVKELSTNTSRKETLENAGLTPIIVVPRVNDVNEGIEQTRTSFDSCYFDEEGCKDGLKALANYMYVFDEKYNTYRKTPLHNWASNYADAFRQFGQGYNPGFGWAGVMKPNSNPWARESADKWKQPSQVL